MARVPRSTRQNPPLCVPSQHSSQEENEKKGTHLPQSDASPRHRRRRCSCTAPRPRGFLRGVLLCSLAPPAGCIISNRQQLDEVN